MKILTFVLIISFVIGPSNAIAGKGPKGGPIFELYEWTQIIKTDFDADRWEPRAGLQTVEFHNHLFVIAGRTPQEPTIDNPFASRDSRRRLGKS